VQECERLSIAILPVLGKPAAAIEPSEGALDDPPLWQHGESVGLIGSPDDLDAQVRAGTGDGGGEAWSLVGGVGEQRSQERVQSKQSRHDENAAVAILNIGGMNDGVEQET
jgi:hypothetical protein